MGLVGVYLPAASTSADVAKPFHGRMFAAPSLFKGSAQTSEDHLAGARFVGLISLSAFLLPSPWHTWMPPLCFGFCDVSVTPH